MGQFHIWVSILYIWSQIYPDEIKGIIGIDPSVPQMTK